MVGVDRIQRIGTKGKEGRVFKEKGGTSSPESGEKEKSLDFKQSFFSFPADSSLKARVEN